MYIRYFIMLVLASGLAYFKVTGIKGVAPVELHFIMRYVPKFKRSSQIVGSLMAIKVATS